MILGDSEGGKQSHSMMSPSFISQQKSFIRSSTPSGAANTNLKWKKEKAAVMERLAIVVELNRELKDQVTGLEYEAMHRKKNQEAQVHEL